MRRVTYIIAFLCVLFANTHLAQAQTNPLFYDYPQNHLKWFSIESDHFHVIFQEGNSRSAQVVSRIAEEVYGPITDFYQLEPDSKVSIVLKDREDFSNGAAFFFDNKIDIWLPALDFPLRGTNNWLRNVITHEFTHIIQIQSGLKRSRKIPAIYFQWLSYERVRRPDVLYGFPNGIITLPFASLNIPAWFAEGTAQFQRTGLHYDTWDSHRDMILRTRILSDTYLDLTEMGTFASKTSIEREVVYNQGYAFTIYLANRFGEHIIRDISHELGEKGVFDVKKAIKNTTGVDGEQVFQDWIAERKAFYTDAINGLAYTKSTAVDDGGFYNLFPSVSPDGKYIAYLSNKGGEGSGVSLRVIDNNGATSIAKIHDDPEFNQHNHFHILENPSIDRVSGGYAFSPDASKIAYVYARKNKYGELYNDLYIYDIATSEKKLITHSSRVQSPVWSSDGSSVYLVQLNQGTQNLVQLDLSTLAFTPLTNFAHGETIFTPKLNASKDKLLFAYANHVQRGIYQLDISTRQVTKLLEEEGIDFRDPFASLDGKYLYFSANYDGIFNIYRTPIGNYNDVEKVTSVLGGAFMPFVDQQNNLLYSEYVASGYKVRKAPLANIINQQKGVYSPAYPEAKHDHDHVDPYITDLNTFDDTDIEPLPVSVMAIADTGQTNFDLPTRTGENERTVGQYQDVFTGFSVFPVVRFDNYSQLNGANGTLLKNGEFADLGENLIRDFKTGIYFSSRDVTDRLSIFGGALIGLGSEEARDVGDFFSPERLVNLDRDVFLIAEQRGLPFIKRSWSPTISIEVFNLHRNVRDGLSIEEFPCTSCLPETSFTNISYEIWEANLFLRSKLNRRSLLELGVGFSPYRVSTSDFFSREFNQFVPGSSSEYFRATTLSASYTFNYYEFNRDVDIAPTGLKGYLRYQYQPSRLLSQFEVQDGEDGGALVPIFDRFKNNSLEAHVRYGKKFNDKHTLQLRTRGFTYFKDPDNFFFLDYIGGFVGMRSYPFFALGGNRTAFTNLSYFTPILKDINTQVGPYTFDKLYARLFVEAGNGWGGPLDNGNQLKTGVGAEIRFATSGYYLFPLRFFISGAYGFSDFSVTLPNEFLTGSQSNRVTYGREFLFHFGLTFDFELL